MTVWVSLDLDTRFSFGNIILFIECRHIFTRTKAAGIFILGLDGNIIPNNYPICCRPLAVPIA